MDTPIDADIKEQDSYHPVHKSANEILLTKGLLTADKNSADPDNEEKLNWMKNVDQEQAEWDRLDSLKRPVSGVVKAIEDILFSEALQYFQTQSLKSPDVSYKIQRSKLSKLKRLLFGPRRMVKCLHEERDLVFGIAQVSVNYDECLHCRVFQTIYKQLIGSKHNCPTFGPHWEAIGFQGNDPATDLRGAGFLALLHLLFLVTEQASVAKEIYTLSTHPEQNFPFCLVSINVTRITLEALREDKLSRICNKRKQVVSVVNDFYLAVFWHIYQIWKNENKTMKDSGHVMKAAEISALKDPRLLLKNLQTAMDRHRKKSNVLPPPLALSRLSTTSSISDMSIHTPALTSRSLDVVLQPVERERTESKSSDPRFAGVCELTKESLEAEKYNSEVTLQL